MTHGKIERLGRATLTGSAETAAHRRELLAMLPRAAGLDRSRAIAAVNRAARISTEQLKVLKAIILSATAKNDLDKTQAFETIANTRAPLGAGKTQALIAVVRRMGDVNRLDDDRVFNQVLNARGLTAQHASLLGEIVGGDLIDGGEQVDAKRAIELVLAQPAITSHQLKALTQLVRTWELHQDPNTSENELDEGRIFKALLAAKDLTGPQARVVTRILFRAGHSNGIDERRLIELALRTKSLTELQADAVDILTSRAELRDKARFNGLNQMLVDTLAAGTTLTASFAFGRASSEKRPPLTPQHVAVLRRLVARNLDWFRPDRPQVWQDLVKVPRLSNRATKEICLALVERERLHREDLASLARLS